MFLFWSANWSTLCAVQRLVKMMEIRYVSRGGVWVAKSRMQYCLCLCLLSLSLSLGCEEEVEGGCEEEDAVLYSAAPPARAIRPYGAGPSSLLIIDWGKNPVHPCPLPHQDLGGNIMLPF